jgi:hypothetical protein
MFGRANRGIAPTLLFESSLQPQMSRFYPCNIDHNNIAKKPGKSYSNH